MTKKSTTPKTLQPAKSASGFNEHVRKGMIRKKWCKPQIHELHDSLKSKLVYLGLPDVKGLDILEWIEHLDKVIAFQCSVYNKVEIDVQELDDLLLKLERENKITSGLVYQGWMEDIVMRGASERGQTYTQGDFLRIYNLDFCNNLATPRETRDINGNKILYYKTDIIKKLLEYQLQVTTEDTNRNFLMYLTVNSDTFTLKEKISDSKVKDYLKKVATVTKPEVRVAREMKAYCYFILKKIFNEAGFHAEFMPTVYYAGSAYPNREKGGKLDSHRMMTFTVLGTKKNKDEVLFEQDTDKFLNEKFIWVTDTSISPYDDTHIVENPCEHDSKKLIQNSELFKLYWKVRGRK